jgi:hypothetical protein
MRLGLQGARGFVVCELTNATDLRHLVVTFQDNERMSETDLALPARRRTLADRALSRHGAESDAAGDTTRWGGGVFAKAARAV